MNNEAGAATLQTLGHSTDQYTSQEAVAANGLVRAFEASPLSTAQRLAAFPRHVRRQDVARFLAKYEIFKLLLPANGSIVECGVFMGSGLMSWYHFSSILEPYNHTRRIIGFDTFEGFPSLDARDTAGSASVHHKTGAFRTHENIHEELQTLASFHDRNRPLGHIPKLELVRGDAVQTIPEWLSRNQHVLISLLYLDFDLHEPTAVALQSLLPRVVAGGIVAFDELNCSHFAGETLAFLEHCGTPRPRLQRLPFDPYISYFVRE